MPTRQETITVSTTALVLMVLALTLPGVSETARVGSSLEILSKHSQGPRWIPMPGELPVLTVPEEPRTCMPGIVHLKVRDADAPETHAEAQQLVNQLRLAKPSLASPIDVQKTLAAAPHDTHAALKTAIGLDRWITLRPRGQY